MPPANVAAATINLLFGECGRLGITGGKSIRIKLTLGEVPA